MSRTGPTPLTAPLDGRLLIEASAGTGKTYTLTTLATRLVVEAGHGIEDLLIVTFTVAATGELRTRIWQTLHAARDAVRADSAVGGGTMKHGFAVFVGHVHIAALVEITLDQVGGASLRGFEYR